MEQNQPIYVRLLPSTARQLRSLPVPTCLQQALPDSPRKAWGLPREKGFKTSWVGKDLSDFGLKEVLRKGPTPLIADRCDVGYYTIPFFRP